MARKRLIDTDVYFDTEICDLLGPRGLHLYFRLWGIADDSGVYEPKFSDISLKMGALRFKVKEVETFIQKLIEAGKVFPYESNGVPYHWLKNFLKHQPLNNPSPPKLPLPEWISCEIKEFPSGKKFASYQVITGKLPEITGSLPVAYPSIETKRNVTKPYMSPNGDGFDSFWTSYERKEAKKKAQEAWGKLNPGKETQEKILRAIETQKKYKARLKAKGEFCPEWPMPATWINGRRWEDELPEVKPTW